MKEHIAPNRGSKSPLSDPKTDLEEDLKFEKVSTITDCSGMRDNTLKIQK